MSQFTPQNYQTLFRLDVVKGRVSGLLSDFIMNGALRSGNPLITFDGAWWALRLHIPSEAIPAEEGLTLFSSEEKYNAYAQEFRAYIKAAQEIITRFSVVQKNFSFNDFQETAIFLQKFWSLYGLTEFVFHDKAHQVMLKTKNSVLEKNLNDLETLKFEGRDVLNAYILEKGTLANVLQSLALASSFDPVLIKYVFRSEIEDMLAGKDLPLERIVSRQKAFVLISELGGVGHIDGSEAENIAFAFRDFEQEQFKNAAQGLKGQIAYKGVVRGKVVISPMLDIKAAMEVERRMQPGDILVVQSTNPDLMSLCVKAGAIVTDQGGMLSHAAIISRELKVPCIVGTVDGTKVLKTAIMSKLMPITG